MILELPEKLISGVSRRLAEASAATASPFTGTEQIQDWGGEWWEYDISIATQLGRDARRLSAFFAELGGKRGRFLLSDPSIENPALPVRRNIIRHTEDFTSPNWGLSRVTTSQISGKEWGIIPNTEMSTHFISQSILYPGQRTLALEAKNDGYNFLRLEFRNAAGAFLTPYVNLTTGEVTPQASVSGSSTPLDDGWFRFVFSWDAGALDVVRNVAIFVGIGPTFGALTFEGDGISGALIRKPQLEPGTAATPYQRVISGSEFDGVKVAGAGQSGKSLNVTGLVGEPLLAGDFFQIGTGPETRLHQLTQDVTITDYAGTLNFVPALRFVPLNAAPVEVEKPKVLLRLRGSVPAGIALGDKFSFAFSAREAL